jgi:hypothetical protein
VATPISIVTTSVGFVAGLFRGIGRSLFWARRCAGVARVIVRWQDIPSNAEALRLERQELAQIQQSRINAQTELRDYRGLKLEELKFRLAHDIKSDEYRCQRLSSILDFRETASKLYCQKERDLRRCERILLKLPDRGEANIIAFRDVCDRIAKETSGRDCIPATDLAINDFVDQAWDAVRHGSGRLNFYGLISKVLKQTIDAL